MTILSLETVESQASYGMGLQLGQQIRESGFTDVDPEVLYSGLCDALNGKVPAIPLDTVRQALVKLQEQLVTNRREKFKDLEGKGQQFLQENAKREGIIQTESGLQYEIIVAGVGTKPALHDRIRVHYTGKLLDGRVFDSSVPRGKAVEFYVNNVVPGWREALLMMPVGSKWKIYIPHNLAYGDKGYGNTIPPYSVLIFDVELQAII